MKPFYALMTIVFCVSLGIMLGALLGGLIISNIDQQALKVNTIRCEELGNRYELPATFDASRNCMLEIKPDVWVAIELYQ